MPWRQGPTTWNNNNNNNKESKFCRRSTDDSHNTGTLYSDKVGFSEQAIPAAQF